MKLAKGRGLTAAAAGATGAERGTSQALGVIPARMRSQRLPGKPIVRIAGRPLIEWVWRRVVADAPRAHWVVATDSEAVAEAVRGFGGAVVMTRDDHLSGTDRVAEAAARPEFRSYDVIVNVQGDEPLLPDGAVESAVRLVVSGGYDVGTVAVPIRSPEEWRDAAVVKVVVAADGSALYFSRAPIPFLREGSPRPEDFASRAFLRHVGLYAFRRPALERWVTLEPAPLERIEALEQLRALAAGLRIGVCVLEGGEPGVDRPEDIARVEPRLNAREGEGRR